MGCGCMYECSRTMQDQPSKIGMCKQCARAFRYTKEPMPDQCGDCNTVYLE